MSFDLSASLTKKTAGSEDLLKAVDLVSTKVMLTMKSGDRALKF